MEHVLLELPNKCHMLEQYERGLNRQPCPNGALQVAYGIYGLHGRFRLGSLNNLSGLRGDSTIDLGSPFVASCFGGITSETCRC